MSDRHSSDQLKAGRRAAGRAESATASAGDPALRQLQASLGNDELRAQLNQGRADRSIMLAHVVDRLTVMHELQGREMNLLDRGASFDWWRDVARADGAETTMPDPNRWHEAAGAYKQAAETLSNGDIGRGRQQLERAMELEDRAARNMTDLVDTNDLESEARPDSGMLDGLVEIGNVEPCDVPDGVALADTIIKTEIDPPKTPEIRRTAKPWWAEEEEEEEGEPEADDAGSP